MDKRFALVKPTKETLEKLYLVDELSTVGISKLYSVSDVTVGRWMRQYDITPRTCRESIIVWHKERSKTIHSPRTHPPETRRKISMSISEWHLLKYGSPPLKEVAVLYEQGFSTTEIASIYNTSAPTIQGWLRKASVPLRNRQQSTKLYWNSHPERNTARMRKMAEGWKHAPTSLERKLINLIEQHHLPFIYTGNGDFWIGNLNPDFVEINGRKVAIEVFGNRWHKDSLDKKIPFQATEKGRKEILSRYGWELIVIWEDDLKREDWEEYCLEQIRRCEHDSQKTCTLSTT